jgi:hypothetical protein
MLTRGAFMLFLSGIALLPSGVKAQEDPACAKYQEPLAYNACLASHGPKANDIGAGVPRTERSGLEPARSKRSATPSRIVQASPYATRRHGRVHMEFRLQ